MGLFGGRDLKGSGAPRGCGLTTISVNSRHSPFKSKSCTGTTNGSSSESVPVLLWPTSSERSAGAWDAAPARVEVIAPLGRKPGLLLLQGDP